MSQQDAQEHKDYEQVIDGLQRKVAELQDTKRVFLVKPGDYLVLSTAHAALSMNDVEVLTGYFKHLGIHALIIDGDVDLDVLDANQKARLMEHWSRENNDAEAQHGTAGLHGDQPGPAAPVRGSSPVEGRDA